MPVDALVGVAGAAGLLAAVWAVLRPKRTSEETHLALAEPNTAKPRREAPSAAAPKQGLTSEADNSIQRTGSLAAFAVAGVGSARGYQEGGSADFDAGPILADNLHYDAEIDYRDRD